MTSSDRGLVQITQLSQAATLSKAQKQFNRLIKSIETERRRLHDWQETLPRYHERVAADYEPLRNSYLRELKAVVQLLWGAYDAPQIKAGERKKLKHLLGSMTSEILSQDDDPEVKAIYNFVTASDYDAEQQQASEDTNQVMRKVFEGVFGVDFDDDIDLSSPENARAALQDQLERIREVQQERDQRAEERRRKRKKTAKQMERESREQQEAQNVSKSIQDVYRKLAATLHPDREPDLDERARKTALMQSVNVAYGKRDLLGLLELQLQVEQIDQYHIDNIAEERLQYFNKVLKEQLHELQREILDLVTPLKLTLGMSAYESLTPKQLMRHLHHDIELLQSDVVALQSDVQKFQSMDALKVWLKAYKVPKKSDRFDDTDLFDPFGSFP
jgi:hypothetical protein